MPDRDRDNSLKRDDDVPSPEIQRATGQTTWPGFYRWVVQRRFHNPVQPHDAPQPSPRPGDRRAPQ